MRRLSCHEPIWNVIWVEIKCCETWEWVHCWKKWFDVKLRNLWIFLLRIFRKLYWLRETKSFKTWQLFINFWKIQVWMEDKEVYLVWFFNHIASICNWDVVMRNIPMINRCSLPVILPIYRDQFYRIWLLKHSILDWGCRGSHLTSLFDWRWFSFENWLYWILNFDSIRVIKR